MGPDPFVLPFTNEGRDVLAANRRQRLARKSPFTEATAPKRNVVGVLLFGSGIKRVALQCLSQGRRFRLDPGNKHARSMSPSICRAQASAFPLESMVRVCWGYPLRPHKRLPNSLTARPWPLCERRHATPRVCVHEGYIPQAVAKGGVLGERTSQVLDLMVGPEGLEPSTRGL